MKEIKIKVGDHYSHQISFSQRDVEKFAKLTLDTNPLHLDKEYAVKSIFKRLIVPGFLSAAVFSKVFGTLFPGIGTIYLYQEMKFMKPVYTDEKYVATFKLTDMISKKNRANIYCKLLDSKGEICIEGQATVMNREKIY